MTDSNVEVKKSEVRAEGVKVRRKPLMDFAPVRNRAVTQPTRKPTEAELERRELARQQVRRREEIQREIETKTQEDIEAKHRADAARRELERKKAEERVRAQALAEKEEERMEELYAERNRQRHEERLAREAAFERSKVIAARRAEAARRELERRQAGAQMKAAERRPVKTPVGSVDPIARKMPMEGASGTGREVQLREDEENHRVYGSVPAEPKKMTRAEREFRALHPEMMGDIDDFAAEIDTADLEEPAEETIEDILNEEVEEDASANNYKYVLGGKSPFINTEFVEKRALGGDNSGISKFRAPGYKNMEEPEEVAAGMQAVGARAPKSAVKAAAARSAAKEEARREERPKLGGPTAGTYVSPAEYPSSHIDTSARADRGERTAAREFGRDLHAKRLPKEPGTATAPKGRYVPYEEPIPHKTLYARRLEASRKERAAGDDVATMVMDKKDKASGIGLALVVFVTVALGAAVGVVAYLAFFQ